MSNQDLNRVHIDFLKESVRSTLSMDILEKGYALYIANGILKVDVAGSVVKAEVLDQSIYQVTLDSDFFQLSSCGCVSKSHCHHIAALFFHLYGGFHNARELIKEWLSEHQKKSKRGRGVQQKPASPHQQLRHDEEKKQKPPAFIQPPEQGSVKDWYRFFEESFEAFVKGNPTYRDIYKVYFSGWLIEAAEDFPSPQRELFLVHAILYTMRLLVAHASPYLEPLSSKSFEKLLADVKEQVSMLPNLANEPALDSLSKQSIIYVHQHLMDKDEDYKQAILEVYMYLWLRIYPKAEWIETNKRRLAHALQNREPKQIDIKAFQPTDYGCVLALATMYQLEGEDEQAMQLLMPLWSNWDVELFRWLDFLAQQKAWKRYLAWLRFFSENVYHKDAFLVDSLTEEWLFYLQKTGDEPSYVEGLLGLLPHSYNELSDFFIEKQDYMSWVELQDFCQVLPTRVGKGVLGAIEKADKDALFAYYHLGIERQIRAKKKEQYKQAVKLLKELKKLYKKYSLLEQWEDYLTQLLRVFSRLSAFKKELERGKLTG